MNTRVSKWGNSLGVRIPKAILADANLSDGDTVDIRLEDGRIVITRAPADYRLDQLVAGITDENRHDETDWGRSMGAETW